MTTPLFKAIGGLLTISFAILSRIEAHGLRFSPILRRLSLSAFRHAFLIGSMAWSAIFNCTTSRGEILPTAAFEMIRSKSPISCNCSSISSLYSGCRKKYSTTSKRSLIGFSSRKGKISHRRRRRPPIGLMVLSMTFSRLIPSSVILSKSSKERTVNLSIRTYRSSSIRDNEVIWAIW